MIPDSEIDETIDVNVVNQPVDMFACYQHGRHLDRGATHIITEYEGQIIKLKW